MLNKAILMGRIANDLEMKTTQNDHHVLCFSIAVERNYGQKDEKETDFIHLVAWRKTADFIKEYFSKGQMIAIEGTLQGNSYTDKDGNKRTSYEVLIEKAYFAGSKAENKTENKQEEISISEENFEKDFIEITDDIKYLPF